MKKLLTLLLAMLMVIGCFASCKDDSTSESKPDEQPTYRDDADYTDMDSYKSYLKYDLSNLYSAIGTVGDATVDANVAAQLAAGLSAIDAAKNITEAKESYRDAANKMAEAVPAADGLLNYSGLDNDEKTKILGKIEA